MSVDLDAAMIELAAGRTAAGSFLELKQAAQGHRLTSLLAFRCGPGDPEAVAYLRGASVRELRLSALQNRLVKELASAGVPAWPYKGPSLRSLLNSPAPRESGDIDLLVRQEHIEKAYQTLLAGRQPVGPGPGVKPLGMRRDAGVRDAESGILIELHWALAAKCWRFVPEPILWDQLEKEGRPSPELLFSILSHHGVVHGFSRLKWLNDLVDLTRLPNWKLPAMIEVSSCCGAELAVDVSLILLDRLLRVPVPQFKGNRRAKRIADLCTDCITCKMSERRLSLQLRLVHLRLAPDKPALLKGMLESGSQKHLHRTG